MRALLILLALAVAAARAADPGTAAPTAVTSPIPPWGALGDAGLGGALVYCAVQAGRALSFFERLTVTGPTITFKLHDDDVRALREEIGHSRGCEPASCPLPERNGPRRKPQEPR